VPEPCYAVREYFRNGGRVAWCVPADTSAGAGGLIAALDALRSVDMGLLVIPEATEAAGVIARADAAGGPWVVPAGAGAIVASATPRTALGEAEIEAIEAAGVNAVRRLPGGETVVWGARLSDPAGEWKYVPVRRLALFIEHSLDQGLAWAAFEPNDEPLWAEVRTETATFMDCLFRSGAFRGDRPEDAYYVRCDRTTMTQHDIDAGILCLIVGFAPFRAAEFEVLTLRLAAGRA
jgi:phage tail sheath protein FI